MSLNDPYRNDDTPLSPRSQLEAEAVAAFFRDHVGIKEVPAPGPTGRKWGFTLEQSSGFTLETLKRACRVFAHIHKMRVSFIERHELHSFSRYGGPSLAVSLVLPPDPSMQTVVPNKIGIKASMFPSLKTPEILAGNTVACPLPGKGIDMLDAVQGAMAAGLGFFNTVPKPYQPLNWRTPLTQAQQNILDFAITNGMPLPPVRPGAGKTNTDIKIPETHGQLFDPVSTLSGAAPAPASMRNVIGTVGALIAERVLGLRLLPIDGNQEICPDFVLDGPNQKIYQKIYGEIKTVGVSGQGLLYSWRADKEEKFFGLDYPYVFVRHGVELRNVNTRDDVVAAFAQNPCNIVACTLGDLRALIGERPAKKFSIHCDPNHGSQRPGYVEGGWQFRISALPWDHEMNIDIQWPAPMRTHIRVPVLSTPNWRRVTGIPDARMPVGIVDTSTPAPLDLISAARLDDEEDWDQIKPF